MSGFSFLKQVQVTAPEKAPRSGGGVRKQRNPTNADLRVFANGSIYPSEALVKLFNLEYGNKPEEKQDPIGNGFDIIDSAEFQQYLQLPAGAKCIWISPVPRAEGRISIFGTCTYNEDGTPKTSVLEQGSVTFGKESMIPLIEKNYELKFSDTVKFLDFKLVGMDDDNTPWTLPENKTVCFVPKLTARGDSKGTQTVQRRENPRFWALVPVEVSKEEADAVNIAEAEEATAVADAPVVAD